ncbi:MAG: ABC transporter permease [Candidatus Sericytochromatia bacterium]|nr:ABC transporter permease [Candidatus Sericytochromatia bacterium]
MRTSEAFANAFESLLLNKVRAGLTMLGIIIGVFAVIVMYGLGQASQGYITSQVQGLGARVLIVTPGNPKSQRSFGPPNINAAPLKLGDAEALEALPGIDAVSPSAFGTQVFKVGAQVVPGTLLGCDPTVVTVRGIKQGRGRFFTDQEARAGARVIVLGSRLAQDLFRGSLADPLGAKVAIGDRRFRVVGVLAPQGGGLFGSVDEQAFVPIRAYQGIVATGERLNSVLVRVASEDLLVASDGRIREVLRRRHHLGAGKEDDFRIQTQADVLSTVTAITGAFTVLLAGIAAISLLVGGIGIMNIMLVSVTERTREIGVRKAVGAKTGAVLRQFLIESATLSLVGGSVGIGLGVLVLWGVSVVASLPFVLSPLALAGAFGFSAGVGVFFGLYPAAKAARLDPVEALRYE